MQVGKNFFQVIPEQDIIDVFNEMRKTSFSQKGILENEINKLKLAVNKLKNAVVKKDQNNLNTGIIRQNQENKRTFNIKNSLIEIYRIETHIIKILNPKKATDEFVILYKDSSQSVSVAKMSTEDLFNEKLLDATKEGVVLVKEALEKLDRENAHIKLADYVKGQNLKKIREAHMQEVYQRILQKSNNIFSEANGQEITDFFQPQQYEAQAEILKWLSFSQSMTETSQNLSKLLNKNQIKNITANFEKILFEQYKKTSSSRRKRFGGKSRYQDIEAYMQHFKRLHNEEEQGEYVAKLLKIGQLTSNLGHYAETIVRAVETDLDYSQAASESFDNKPWWLGGDVKNIQVKSFLSDSTHSNFLRVTSLSSILIWAETYIALYDLLISQSEKGEEISEMVKENNDKIMEILGNKCEQTIKDLIKGFKDEISKT